MEHNFYCSKLLLAFLILTTQIQANAIPRSNIPKTKTPDLARPAAFREDWQRYPAPPTIMQTVRGWFYADASQVYTIRTGCSPDNEEVARNLGGNLPITGQPISQEPNPTFLAWYTACLGVLGTAERSSLMAASFRSLTPEEQIQFAPYVTAVATNEWAQGKRYWKQIELSQQQQIVDEIFLLMVGPDDVWLELGLTKDVPALKAKMLAKVNRFNLDGRVPLPGASAVPAGMIELVTAVQLLKFQIAMMDILRF